jgi:hypothetical protein
MSASEKLKTLERQGVRFMLEPRPENGYWHNALPQIIAVVEAAERMDAAIETNSEEGTPEWFLQPIIDLEQALGE